MEKISRDQFKALKTKHGHQSPVRFALEQLEKGELLSISRKDYTNKRGPIDILHRIRRERKKKFILHTLVDGSGWVAERVE